MRYPVKVCKGIVPKFVRKILPTCYNPAFILKDNVNDTEFSNAMQSFKFGKTFKSTQHNRFPETLELIKTHFYNKSPIILDIGASDGVTSCDVINNLNFRRYFVTDYNIHALYYEVLGFTFFFDNKKEILLASCNLFVVFNDLDECFYVLRILLNKFFYFIAKYIQPTNIVTLINPRLRKMLNDNILFLKYSLFEDWNLDKPDLIICANILNHEYFTEEELVEGVRSIKTTQKDGSILVLIDNRENEQSSVLKYSNGIYRLLYRVGIGSDVESLFLGYTNG